MEAVDYAISKDIRNSQIVRELDRSRQRELWRWAGVGAVIVTLLLYSAWQHFELIQHGYRVDQMQKARKQEEEVNRHLRLWRQQLESPQRISAIATDQLRMREPKPGESIVLERAHAAQPPARSVLASR
jgi:cell division protein FtsL